MPPKKPLYPMRINKYLAHKQYSTRREADALIAAGKVFINGTQASLGDKVAETDVVDVRFRKKEYRYYAYNKPRGIITNVPQEGQEDIADIVDLKGVFPIGRLDKDSYGLIILTDDGRITDPLLNPEREHEKEYEVTTLADLPPDFKQKMEAGVDIGGYKTKPCRVTVLGPRQFSIALTEGKKHQIRRMCGVFGASAIHLMRTRIMNIKLAGMRAGKYRLLQGRELSAFLKALGLKG